MRENAKRRTQRSRKLEHEGKRTVCPLAGFELVPPLVKTSRFDTQLLMPQTNLRPQPSSTIRQQASFLSFFLSFVRPSAASKSQSLQL